MVTDRHRSSKRIALDIAVAMLLLADQCGFGRERGRRSAQGQAKRDLRAAARAILGPNPTAVRDDNRLANRQSQSGARSAVGRGRRSAVEFFEHALFFSVRQSRAAVRHRQDDLFGLLPGADFDGRA
jgi:hypothetical protein